MHSISKHRIAYCTGIPRFVNWLHRQKLLVVNYHGLFDRLTDGRKLPPTFVHVNRFRDQLLLLKSHYHMIRPEVLLEAIVEKRRLPDHAALVTFDDAYANFYELAAPLLESLDIVPIVFVPTLYVKKRIPFWYDLVWFFLINGEESDRRWFLESIRMKPKIEDKAILAEACLAILKRKSFAERNCHIEPLEKCVEGSRDFYAFVAKNFLAMTTEQIQRLSERGFHFGGHTHSHTILSAADDGSVRNDIAQNKSTLESITGKQSFFFAYPNGGVEDFSNRHKKMLTQAGYASAFSLIQHRSSHLSDPMAMGRINTAPEDVPESLWFRCTGITPLITKVRHLIGYS